MIWLTYKAFIDEQNFNQAPIPEGAHSANKEIFFASCGLERFILPLLRMIAVSNNPHYELNYDRTKNRIYLRINNYWKAPEVVPNYLSDWNKVIELATPGYTLLADFRNMLTHPASVKEMHEAVAFGRIKIILCG